MAETLTKGRYCSRLYWCNAVAGSNSTRQGNSYYILSGRQRRPNRAIYKVTQLFGLPSLAGFHRQIKGIAWNNQANLLSIIRLH